MWEQLTPADIRRARERLTALRAVTLNRHAEEIKRLDLEQAEIEAFERLAETFAQRYVNALAAKAAIDDQASAAAATEKELASPARSEVPWESPVPEAPLYHQVSPNFGTPPRLRRFAQ